VRLLMGAPTCCHFVTTVTCNPPGERGLCHANRRALAHGRSQEENFAIPYGDAS
jgi:hypothetical protein